MVRLGKFEILEELGRGGFGIVYKARDSVLNRLVALKELHPGLVLDPSFVSKFRREAEIAANLDHPNLVPVHEFGQAEGRYYIVMAYMPGGSLKELIKREGKLAPKRALEILEQVGAG
ncbi:MAG TPA: serine/threonine-protein kinase, partial [Anaerolineaceae bacterium]|nr:serine/threonine-protein kinase [Anaerolineaceae bacterium]